MSALPKILPDPLPLDVDGGRRFIRHPVDLRDFPFECRHVVREVWDALIGQDFDDVTILPDRLTDRFLKQLTGRSPRSVQDGLYYAELGAARCNVLIGIERQLRDLARKLDALAGKPELCTTDADRARVAELAAERDRLRADLLEFRQSWDALKTEYRQLTARMVMITSKPELTEEDRDRLVELAARRDAVRAEIIAPDSLIFRHSGPGFGGNRRIEILARVAAKKEKEPRPAAAKAKAKAPGNPSRDRQIPNVGTVKDCTPEEVAAIQAAAKAREEEHAATAAGPMTPEEQANFNRFFGPAAEKRREAERRRTEQAEAAARRLEEKRRPKSGPTARDDIPTVLAFGIPPEPDDSS
jgi:hypothetical protein